MKFEGQQVNIPIKGIMRAGTDNLCADGAMNEVIGMEYKDGSWLPYKEGEEVWNVLRMVLSVKFPVTNIKDVIIHKTSDDGEHLLFLLSDGSLMYEVHRDPTNKEIEVAFLTDGVKDLSVIGNQICVNREGGIVYYAWKDKDNTYEHKIYDRDTDVSLRVVAGLHSDTRPNVVGYEYTDKIMEQTSMLDKDKFYETVLSTIIAANGAVREHGGLTGFVLACAAYRLKNGEVVAASAPVLLGPPNHIWDDGDILRINNLYYNNLYKELFAYGTSADNPDYTKLCKTDGTTPGDSMQDFAIFTMPKSGDFAWWNESDREGKDTLLNEKELRVVQNTEPLTIPYKHIVDSDEQELAVFVEGSSEINDAQYIHEDNIHHPLDHAGWNAFYIQNTPAVPQCACSILSVGQSVSGGSTKIHQIFTGYSASNKLQYFLPDIGNLHDTEIESVCIFISQEINAYPLDVSEDEFGSRIHSNWYPYGKKIVDYHGGGFDHEIWANTIFVKKRTSEQIFEDLKNVGTLYLAKELYIDELTEGAWVDIDLKGNLGDALVTREQMPLTALIDNVYKPEHTEAYNYRLHMYDYFTNFFKGYPFSQFGYFYGEGQYADEEIDGTQSGKTYKWEIRTKIKDEQGEATVVVYDSTGISSIRNTLSPVLLYPNIYAEEMTISVYEFDASDSSNNRIYERTFSLRKWHNMGVAAYTSSDLEPIKIIDSAYVKKDSSDNPIVPEEFVPTQPSDDVRVFNNALKVSDVAFPSYFPPQYTYRFGNGKIIGLSRLTIPVSQDNTGRDKLVIFCTDGIYTMDVDASGNGAYTNQYFASPEVCVNRNSICEIGGAVFFASDKGLMVYTGEKAVELYLPELNGAPRFLPASAESKEAHGIYKKMINSTALLSKTAGDFNSAISNGTLADFADFIKDADTHLVYISIKNKLLAYNKNKDYSYFIDIPSHCTTKLQVNALCDDGNNIGKKLWEKVGNNYNIQSFGYVSEEDDEISCLIQSRPIKVQQDDKCSYRVVLAGYFEGKQGNWADIVAMGSLDGEHWRVIGMKEKKLEGGFHNLGCLTERGTWKYLMFIFGGKLTSDSHLDSIDITVEGRYNNKKR